MTIEIVSERCEYLGKEFILERPGDPCELIHLESPDEIIPYWAEEWPSSEVAMALLPQLNIDRSATVLEIGAGAGTVSVRLNQLFPHYIAADYAVEGCDYIVRNAQKNDMPLFAVAMDWNCSPFARQFDTIIGIDILYEKEMCAPVLRFLSDRLSGEGSAYIFDPQRFFWKEFKEMIVSFGLKVKSSQEQKSSNGATIEMIEIGRDK